MSELVLHDLASAQNWSMSLAKSDLLPDAYRGKPPNVLVALEYARGLGVAPMAVLQGIHIIKGKPVPSAQFVAGLVRRAGHTLRVKGDDRKATAVIIRADDPGFEFSATWTIERAQKAGLTNKDTWRVHPAAMLKARAITECARDACSEILSGLGFSDKGGTADELEAVVVEPTVTVSRKRNVVDHVPDIAEIAREAIEAELAGDDA